MSLVDQARRARRIFLRERYQEFMKHDGPGRHESGSEQDVHGGGKKQPGSEKGAILSPWGMDALSDYQRKAVERTIGGFITRDGQDFAPEGIAGRVRALFERSHSEDPDAHEGYMRWYQDAHDEAQFLADTYGMEVDQASGLIAALSPQTKWESNQEQAWSLADLLTNDEAVGDMWTGRKRPSEMTSEELGVFLATGVGGRGLNQSSDNFTKAVKLIRGEGDPDDILGGPKVRSFYNNILVPDEPTSWTDDTHMRRIWLSPSRDADVYPDVRTAEWEGWRKYWERPGITKKGEEWTYGTYPWFAEHAGQEAERLGVLPHDLQAVAWSRWKRENDDG